MREIRFRAWAKHWKRMEHFTLQDIYWMGENTGDYDFPDENWELMQFTGLKDKNGKEIYEGDIVSADDGGEYFTYEGHPEYPDKFPIIWNEEGARFDLEGKDDMEISPFYGYATLEVIGNIYENPELLNEK